MHIHSANTKRSRRSFVRVAALGALSAGLLITSLSASAIGVNATANVRHRTAVAGAASGAPDDNQHSTSIAVGHPIAGHGADVRTAKPLATRVHVEKEPTRVPKTTDVAAEEAAEERGEDLGKAYNDPKSTNYMTYNNGPVQTAPRVYMLLWGKSFWTTNDTYGMGNRVARFYQGVGGSVWGSEMKEYNTSSYKFTNPTGVYKGYAYDSTPVPAHPTQLEVQAAAARARRYFNDYGYNTQFVVLLPPGHDDQVELSGACGYHSWGTDNGYGFTYTSLPYLPSHSGCGNYSASNSNMDSTTMVASHEYGETVTDPYGTGWKDSNGMLGENGDKCAWIYPGVAHFSNDNFAVQSLWSNYYRRYYNNGCLYPANY